LVADPSCMILIRIRIHRPRMTSLDGKSVRAVTSGYGGWRFSPLKYSISNVLAKKIKVSFRRVESRLSTRTVQHSESQIQIQIL
jgi:hypothetical protein